jgi:hypothetical protein
MADETISPNPTSDERRRSSRHVFRHVQKIVFGEWTSKPPDRVFFEVEFIDVSATGCAFLFETRPPASHLVVRLGAVESPVFLQAEICRTVDRSRDGATSFLIGCRFTTRLADGKPGIAVSSTPIPSPTVG